MESKKTTVHLSALTQSQIAKFQHNGYGTMTMIISLAIDRMSREDKHDQSPIISSMTPVELSSMIYNAILRVASLVDPSREVMATTVDDLIARLTAYSQHLHDRRNEEN